MSQINRELIAELLMVAKRLDEKNLVNAFEGNISIRDDHGSIYITPSGKNKAFLTAEMIAVIDKDGRQIAGDCKPSSELPMHSDTYKIRDDIKAVVHAHPPYLTAYALANKDVVTRAYPEMMGNFTRFYCAPYGRPGTDKVLMGAIPILKKHDVVILGNHGALTVGNSSIVAMNRMEAAEAITQVIYLTERMGKSVDLSDEECAFFFSLNGH